MSFYSTAASHSSTNQETITVQDANEIVERLESEFPDISIDPKTLMFSYSVGDGTYSVPVEDVRHLGK